MWLHHRIRLRIILGCFVSAIDSHPIARKYDIPGPLVDNWGVAVVNGHIVERERNMETKEGSEQLGEHVEGTRIGVALAPSYISGLLLN